MRSAATVVTVRYLVVRIEISFTADRYFKSDFLLDARRCRITYGSIPFGDTEAAISATPRLLLRPMGLPSTPIGTAFVPKRQRPQTGGRGSDRLRPLFPALRVPCPPEPRP